MPVTVDWGNEAKTLLILRFISPWNWNDYHRAMDTAWMMADTANHKIDFIADFSQGRTIPYGAVIHFQRPAMRVHPNRGFSVIVGTNILLQVIHAIMMRLYPEVTGQSRIVATLEEAHTLIQKYGSAREHA